MQAPRIPTNVLTGFLGVGKTTAILDLLHSRRERWAVLVNEFGDVSIDGAILEGGAPADVAVREVGGGCVCCATAPHLPVALHLLLTEAKPTRLLVETTGLGHPARLLDRLRTQYADRLDVRATIGLVAPDDVTNEHVLANPIFREQVDLAEVLVLNKLDRARPGDVEAFHTWADELFPPKLLIAATEQGKLDPAWLDVGAPPSAGLPMALEAAAPLAPPTERVSPGARGWIFPASDTFDEAKLLAFLSGLASTRLKGVFRVADGSIVVNRAGAQTTVRPTHYRLDSRVEIFGDLDWARVETGLTDCRIER